MTDRDKVEKLQNAIVEASNILTSTVKELSNPKTIEDMIAGYKKYGDAILRVHVEVFKPVMTSMLEK